MMSSKPLTQHLKPQPSVVDFSISNQDIDELTDIAFLVSLSAITTTGGTFHRLVSGAENLLTRVELYAGEQLIESIYGESITIRNLMLQTNEHKNRFYRLLGNDTSANLVTKAGSAQDLIISIPSFYNTGNGFFLKGLTVPLRLYIEILYPKLS